MARESTPFPVVRLRGYDMGQVNAFVRAAVAERRRLAAENENLRERLQQTSSELALRENDALQPRVTPATLVSADQAAAILAQAQRTAELTVAQARHQASATLRAAVEKAEALAQASETQLARTRDEVQATQARLVGLQALETEYRSRLRSWAADVLTDLGDGGSATESSYHVDVMAGTLDFGDGETGERLPSDAPEANVRSGAGASGNVSEPTVRLDRVEHLNVDDLVEPEVVEPDAVAIDDDPITDTYAYVAPAPPAGSPASPLALFFEQFREPRAEPTPPSDNSTLVADPEVPVATDSEPQRSEPAVLPTTAVKIPRGVLPDAGVPQEPMRPPRAWFAPVGSPHRPADV